MGDSEVLVSSEQGGEKAASDTNGEPVTSSVERNDGTDAGAAQTVNDVNPKTTKTGKTTKNEDGASAAVEENVESSLGANADKTKMPSSGNEDPKSSGNEDPKHEVIDEKNTKHSEETVARGVGSTSGDEKPDHAQSPHENRIEKPTSGGEGEPDTSSKYDYDREINSSRSTQSRDYVKLVFSFSPPSTDEETVRRILENSRIERITFSEVVPEEQSRFGQILVPTTQEADGIIAEFNNTTHGDVKLSVMYPGQLRNRSPVANTRYNGVKLFVGHLPKDYGSSEIRNIFEPFGPVSDVYVLRHAKSRCSKGCAFVSFEKREDAYKAIEELNESKTFPSVPKALTVCIANPQNAPVALKREGSRYGGRSPIRNDYIGYDESRRELRTKRAMDDRDAYRLERGRVLRLGPAAALPRVERARSRERREPRDSRDRRVREPISRDGGYRGFDERPRFDDAAVGRRASRDTRDGYMNSNWGTDRRRFEERREEDEQPLRRNDRRLFQLYVQELPLDCDESTLREVFNYYGETLKAKVNRDNRNRTDGTGVVGFATYKEANAAYLALTGQSYLMPGSQRPLRVKHMDAESPQGRPEPYSPSDRSREKSRRDIVDDRNPKRTRLDGGSHRTSDTDSHGDQGNGGLSQRGVESVGGPRPHSATRVSEAGSVPRSKEIKLYVAGIPYSSTEEDVRQVFEVYGTVADIHVMRDPSGRSKGSGFVAYTVRSEADAAISQLHGSFAMDKARPLRVDFARPKGTGPVGGHARRGGYGGHYH